MSSHYTPIRHFGKIANYHGCGWSPTYFSHGCGCGYQPCGCVHPPTDLNSIATMLRGRHINTAMRIYNNVRVVIRDGENLIVTTDYVPHRINVETSNNIIVRIVGFY